MIRFIRFVLPTALAASTLATSVRAVSDVPADGATAVDVIRAAIVERLADTEAEIRIDAVDLPPAAPDRFRDAVPEPGSRLGKPMRFLLRPATGRPVLAVARATVVADQVVLKRMVARGARLAPGDFGRRRGELAGMTLRHQLTFDQLDGARARRLLEPGTVLSPIDVVVRRAVEPGDVVTVVAIAGVVEVSANLVAADGGDKGDLVRVVNPDTRRDMRARVTGRGRVEVRHDR